MEVTRSHQRVQFCETASVSKYQISSSKIQRTCYRSWTLGFYKILLPIPSISILLLYIAKAKASFGSWQVISLARHLRAWQRRPLTTGHLGHMLLGNTPENTQYHPITFKSRTEFVMWNRKGRWFESCQTPCWTTMNEVMNIMTNPTSNTQSPGRSVTLDARRIQCDHKTLEEDRDSTEIRRRWLEMADLASKRWCDKFDAQTLGSVTLI